MRKRITYMLAAALVLLLTATTMGIYIHYFETDEIRAFDSAGLKLYDDAGAGIHIQDGGDILITDGDLDIRDTSALGSESLNETDFATHAKWDVTGDFDDSGGNAAYTHSAGSGTLTQTSGNMAISGVSYSWYKFAYTVSGATGDAAATITTAFAASSTSLTISNGSQSTFFKTGASPGNFVISGTSTSGGFTLDDVSLKEITGGDLLINGLLRVEGVIAEKQLTIAADDTSPDVSGGSIFTTSANTGATAITDLDNPTPGQVVYIVGGSDTNSSTIADSGNFNLDCAWTGTVDAMLVLYVQADNDYIEITRFPAEFTQLPAGTNPTTDLEGEIAWDTDDDAIEIYDGTTSWLMPSYEDIDALIFQPDQVNDEIAIFHVDARLYPHGIKLVNVQITLPADAAYSMVFEEWAGDPPAAQNDIETVTTTASDAYKEVEDTDIDDQDIDADDYIFLHVPATDVDWIAVKVIFHVKEGD